jgi:hypothetical protein
METKDLFMFFLGALLGAFLTSQANGQEPSVSGEDYRVWRGEGYTWTRVYPDMTEDNVEITEEHSVPLAVLAQRFLDGGGVIGEGQIVLGLSTISRYTFNLPGRKQYKCHVQLWKPPHADRQTYEHELRHCRGWVHD